MRSNKGEIHSQLVNPDDSLLDQNYYQIQKVLWKARNVTKTSHTSVPMAGKSYPKNEGCEERENFQTYRQTTAGDDAGNHCHCKEK